MNILGGKEEVRERRILRVLLDRGHLNNKDFNQNIPDVKSFKVIGFFRTEFSEFDNNIILGNIEDILDIYGWDANQAGYLNITVENKDETGIDL